MRAALVCVVAAVVAAGCGDDPPDRSGGPGTTPRICTEIGCRSGVTFHLGELPESARRARVCVRDRCRTVAAGDRGPEQLFVPTPDVRIEREVPVSVHVGGSGGARPIVSEIDVRMRAERPNGPGCPPRCLQAHVRYDRIARRLYEAPALGR